MGASKSRACSTCTVQMCRHKQYTGIPKDNNNVDTDICQPRPKFERKLVSFSKCGDNNCLPGNRKQCNCQAKCMHYRPCENSNACKCQKKHECVKVLKKTTCKSHTGDNENSIRGDGHLEEPICVTRTVNCGAMYKNEIVNEAMNEVVISQILAKSQAKNQANDDRTSIVTEAISSQSPVKFSTNYNQNPAEVQPVISQQSDSETAQQTVYNLCIAINEQLIQLKQTKMPYLDKNSLKQNYEDVGREVNKLCKTLTYEKNSQKFDAHSILITAKSHQTHFECIKNKHERLRQRFKNHRKSLLFYICQFLSCCCDC